MDYLMPCLLRAVCRRSGPRGPGRETMLRPGIEKRGETMNAYCLFCNTMKRDELAAAIRQAFDMQVIAPKIIQRKWVKGEVNEVVHDYLPGYLFLYADSLDEALLRLVRLDNVYRVLGEKENGYRLMGANLAFAEMLRDCGGVIGVLKTCRVGDRVRLAEGAMGKVEGEILKLDRRGRALVQFVFDGSAVKSWVAIEMVEARAEDKPEDPGEGSGASVS